MTDNPLRLGHHPLDQARRWQARAEDRKKALLHALGCVQTYASRALETAQADGDEVLVLELRSVLAGVRWEIQGLHTPPPAGAAPARDGVTRLYGAAQFEELATLEFTRSQRFGRTLSLAVLEVDGWDDAGGPAALVDPDTLLLTLADRLRQVTRDVDVLARLDGATFALLMPETHLAAAREAVRRICQQVRDGAEWRELHPDLGLTLSAGVSSDDGAMQLHSIMRTAHAHLAACRLGGGNRVHGGA